MFQEYQEFGNKNIIFIITFLVIDHRNQINLDIKNLISDGISKKHLSQNPRYLFGKQYDEIKLKIINIPKSIYSQLNALPKHSKDFLNIPGSVHLVIPIAEMSNYFYEQLYNNSEVHNEIEYISISENIMNLMLKKGKEPVYSKRQPFPFWRYYYDIFNLNVY